MVKVARSPAAPKTPAKAVRRPAVKAAAPKSATRGSAKTPPTPPAPSTRKPRASSKASAPGGRAATIAVKPSVKAKTGRAASASTASKPAKTSAGAATAFAPINLGFLSGFVGFHLRLAQDASYRAFARFKDKDLVKPGRFPALAIIHLNPGISQSALGRAIARDKSTVSPLIKDLQKNGLISRKPSPNDRRSVTLVLTKKGERVLDRLHARALEHEEDLDKLVGTAKARLVGMLDKITGGLAVTA